MARIQQYFSRFGTSQKIIVYLRRHDLWIASLFNQALKTSPKPHYTDIRDYFIFLLGSSEIDIKYPKILDRWATHFGAENLIVRPFESGQFRSGDFLWDFLGVIRDDIPDLLQQEGLQSIRINESIPHELIRLISHVRASSFDLASKDAMTSLVLKAQKDITSPARTKQPWDNRLFELPPDLRRAIVMFFADDYAYIAGKYLGVNDRVLFREAIQ